MNVSPLRLDVIKANESPIRFDNKKMNELKRKKKESGPCSSFEEKGGLI